MTRHTFDITSMINPVTGRPYPRWLGAEPLDSPDPLCVCGGQWVDDACDQKGTVYGRAYQIWPPLADMALLMWRFGAAVATRRLRRGGHRL